MGKVSKGVLEKIKKKNIKPIPKWQFMLKESFVWGVFIINLLLGSIGFAVIIYIMAHNDIVYDFSLAKDAFEWIILSIPILWVVLTLFFLFVAYYNFKNTQGGYRFSVGIKLLINLGITILLSLILYTSGLSGRLNILFSDNIPFYSHSFDMRQEVWMRPEEGYLSGEILEVDTEEEEISLKDFDEKEWDVEYTDALVKERVVLGTGEKIKIKGDISSDTVFVASEIRPWQGGGKRMQEN